MPDFVNKVLLGYSHIHLLCIVCGCFCTRPTQLSTCNRNCMVYQFKYLYSMALQNKSKEEVFHIGGIRGWDTAVESKSHDILKEMKESQVARGEAGSYRGNQVILSLRGCGEQFRLLIFTVTEIQWKVLRGEWCDVIYCSENLQLSLTDYLLCAHWKLFICTDLFNSYILWSKCYYFPDMKKSWVACSIWHACKWWKQIWIQIFLVQSLCFWPVGTGLDV